MHAAFRWNKTSQFVCLCVCLCSVFQGSILYLLFKYVFAQKQSIVNMVCRCSQFRCQASVRLGLDMTVCRVCGWIGYEIVHFQLSYFVCGRVNIFRYGKSFATTQRLLLL